MADEKTWEGLFQNALHLVDEIQTHGTKHLYWTFGGGTVLMRKYHRLSKDIDIFVPEVRYPRERLPIRQRRARSRRHSSPQWHHLFSA